jgi:hypothetical protein
MTSIQGLADEADGSSAPVYNKCGWSYELGLHHVNAPIVKGRWVAASFSARNYH